MEVIGPDGKNLLLRLAPTAPWAWGARTPPNTVYCEIAVTARVIFLHAGRAAVVQCSAVQCSVRHLYFM